MLKRLERLWASLEEMGCYKQDSLGFLVSNPTNRLYLSGFTGESGYLLLTPQENWLLTDGRFIEQAREEAPGFEVVDLGKEPLKKLGEVVAQAGLEDLYFEEEDLTFAAYRRLEEAIENWPRKPILKPASKVVERLRAIKEPEEVKNIQQAIEVAEAAWKHIQEYLKPGIREKDIALELEYFMRKKGATAAAFPIIVASGPRSAWPHGKAGDRKLKPGDLVVLDFGAVYQGYCSDLTRTVVIAPATDEQHKIYRTVLTAQEKALEALKSGISGREVDALARSYIEEEGLGSYFNHGLGHGVGLSVHESPTLSWREEAPLPPQAVVTVEPGVYIPGWGGIRIEDMALVEEGGCRLLSKASREFLEL
ncbi:Xaa-Pro aminopeptidase [Thermanaeromonas toyohensis ToBE]|uniref:Xaa-Pro aminopeptidase n=1 Tax=Thermanaeromonas toyohensis ToBE TaxID=698762 RepID=A0A1W1VZ20_9FIRM|nr:aminopeptidase P family protein [Thermanaeromonas toyohensis]SMB98598.1 Xaa-Pro aminopeptidase [Thermanaeromonas toyohensis ToBE]